MTVTDAEARRFDTERVMGLIGYGLLFSGIFFAGVPAIVAVIMAYSQRGSASPVLRDHYRFQIQIFWIGMLMGLIAGICGLWATIDAFTDAGGRQMHETVDVSDLDFSPKVIGLYIAAGVGLALMTLWSLAAPAVGFLRLVTAPRPVVAA